MKVPKLHIAARVEHPANTLDTGESAAIPNNFPFGQLHERIPLSRVYTCESNLGGGIYASSQFCIILLVFTQTLH